MALRSLLQVSGTNTLCVCPPVTSLALSHCFLQVHLTIIVSISVNKFVLATSLNQNALSAS